MIKDFGKNQIWTRVHVSECDYKGQILVPAGHDACVILLQ